MALLSLLLGGCGPTEMQAGQAVLLMAPLVTLVGALFASTYARGWQPLAKDLRFDWRPSLRIIAFQIVACLGVPFLGEGAAEWLVTALCFVGTSYLSFQCLSLRFALLPGLRRHYSWLCHAPWLLLYGPALWLSYLGSQKTELDGLVTLLWCLPGYLGLVTGPLVLLLLVEMIIRRKRLADRLREESLPRPLPQARVL